MNDWLMLVLMTFAAYRITWLIVKDSFPPIARVRDWIITKEFDANKFYVTRDADGDMVRDGKGLWHWLKTLIICTWCVSVWASAFVVLLVDVLSERGLGQPWLWFGAVAGGSALVAQLTSTVIDRE